MKKRAIISVSDKTGVVEFASELAELNYEIISTGGTKKRWMQLVSQQLPLMRSLIFRKCWMDA